MKNKISFLTTLAFLFIFGILNGQTTDWNNGGGNWQRNGYVDVAGPTTDSILWQVNSLGAFGSPILIEGNYLVSMRYEDQSYSPVECYNLTTGNLLWSIDVTNSTGRSLPVGLRDGRVFIVGFTDTSQDSLYAFDVTNNSPLWTFNGTVSPFITETAVFDSVGNLYIYAYQKTYKINPTNGQIIWETPTSPNPSGSGEMAINNSTNTGYTLENGNGQAYIWATNLTTGEKTHSHIVTELQLGGNVPQSPLMVGFDGNIYVQLTQDNVAAFSDNGTEFSLLWQTEIYGNSPFSRMCIGADGSIYAPTDGKIIRIDQLTGDTLNISETITEGGFFISTLSAANNNMIYATNGENTVYAFDQNLNILWSDFLPSNNISGVCIAANGLAVVSGGNNIRVYTPVDVNAAPLAEFSVNSNQICAGSCVNFLNESTNGPFSSVLWTFTGGSPASSTSDNPQVCYAVNGIYPVSLSVVNDLGSDILTTAGFIEVSNNQFTIGISPPGPVSICEGESIILTAQNGLSNYEWSNGTNGAEIIVTESGDYSVSAENSGGCIGISNLVNVEISPIPVASFTFLQTFPEYLVEFTNTSSGNGTYVWNFPGGNTSTLENPEFQFPFDNTWPVTLIASNNCGIDTLNTVVAVIKTSIDDGNINNSDGYAFISNNQIYFRTEQFSGKNIVLSCYSSLGQAIVNERIDLDSGTLNSISIPDLNFGIYYLKLQNNSKIWIKKIIKI